MNYIRHLNAFFAIVKQDPNLTAAHVSLYMAMFQSWNYNRFQNPFPIQREYMMQLCKIGSKNTYHRCVKDLHQAGYIFYHTQVSKFKHIKISIVRLDKISNETDTIQLDVFSQKETESHGLESNDLEKECLPALGGDLEGPICPINITDISINNDTTSCLKNDTDSVPNMTATSPKNDTVLVPDMGRNYIKQNNKTVNSVCKTPTQIFNKNLKISKAVNAFVRGTKITEMTNPPLSAGVRRPTKSEVETFFRENNYPIPEAKKFFYYNHGKGWMLTDRIPITNWQSLAHKWMLNETKLAPPPNSSILQNNNDKNYSEPL